MAIDNHSLGENFCIRFLMNTFHEMPGILVLQLVVLACVVKKLLCWRY